ncbi:ripening-related protein 1 [Spatholobus suberectus]|nr:ripening-related protein 1 [Spatholobus suberectus]
MNVHHLCLATPRPTPLFTSFEKGGDGVALHNVTTSTIDDTTVMALSTRWFNKKSRCLHNITISANGRGVVAMLQIIRLLYLTDVEKLSLCNVILGT